MRTAHLPTVCDLVATTRCQYQGIIHQVSKFEQVSSDGSQMSPAGGWSVGPYGALGPMSQCIIGNGHMGDTPIDRMTDGQHLPTTSFTGGNEEVKYSLQVSRCALLLSMPPQKTLH